jgi:hypothetical protein
MNRPSPVFSPIGLMVRQGVEDAIAAFQRIAARAVEARAEHLFVAFQGCPGASCTRRRKADRRCDKIYSYFSGRTA